MNSATLLDNFDLIAEAPGGVPKLRELILHLAVRGKLVKQEKRIEGPYAVPPGWRWTTLIELTEEPRSAEVKCESWRAR